MSITDDPTTTPEKAALPGVTRLIKPTTFAEALDIAGKLAESDLVPAAYKKKAANIVIAWEMGAEIGLSPMTALQSIAVINGKPCLYGEAPLAVVMASGLLEQITEEDDGDCAVCIIKRRGWPKEIKRTFSMAEAAAAKMYEREADGSGKWKPLIERWAWQSWPKDMRKYRARGRALKDAFADVLKGLEIAEKVADEGNLDGTGTVIEMEKAPAETGFTPRRLSETAETSPAPSEPVKAADTVSPVTVDVTTVPTPEPPPAEPAVAPPVAPPAPAAAPAVETPAGPQTFTLNGVTHTTRGLSREQFLESATLVPKADKRIAKGYSKTLLAKILGVPVSDPKCHRNELTAEQGARWIEALKAAVSGDQTQAQGTLT